DPGGIARLSALWSTASCSGLKSKPRARSSADGRRGQEIAQSAHGLDDVDVEFLADAADEHLDGVGVAVEVLVVEMLDQFGARDHAAGVMHQIGQQPVLMRGHLD